MKVALVGGTGFVGSHLVDELIQQGHHPVLLVRPGSESKVQHPNLSSTVSGEVSQPEAIRNLLSGCDAAIYNVGILRENRSQGITFQALQLDGAKRVIDLALELEVKRFILTSANGAKPDGTAYQRTKYLAEQYLKTTELEWTIFRPSVMFGDPRGQREFCTDLYQQIVRAPLPAPLFYEGVLPVNAGAFALSPVHVRDVATVYVKSLTMPETVHQTFALCGPEPLEWKTIIQTIAQASGAHNKWTLPAPAFVVKMWAALLEQFPFFPVTRDQITMLLEGNTCDDFALSDVFGVVPTPFNEETLSYLRQPA